MKKNYKEIEFLVKLIQKFRIHKALWILEKSIQNLKIILNVLYLNFQETLKIKYVMLINQKQL